MIDGLESASGYYDVDDFVFNEYTCTWERRQVNEWDSAIPIPFRFPSARDEEFDVRVTKRTIELLDDDYFPDESPDGIIGKSLRERLDRWRSLAGHKIRRIAKEAKKGAHQINELAKKSGGSGEVTVAQTSFGPGSNSTVPTNPQPTVQTTISTHSTSPLKSEPEFTPPSMLPPICLVTHDNFPQNPFPNHIPEYQPTNSHHFEMPNSNPIHFTPPQFPLSNALLQPITTPQDEPQKTETIVQEEKETPPTTQLEEIVHPIRRTEETERIGSIAIASMTTALQQTTPIEPAPTQNPLLRSLQDVKYMINSQLSNITHSILNIFGPAITELGRGQDLISNKILNIPSDQEQQSRDKIKEGHEKIDSFFATHQAHTYDPSYKPHNQPVIGEIPLPSEAFALLGRVGQMSALESKVAQTSNIALDTIKTISSVEKAGMVSNEVNAAKNIKLPHSVEGQVSEITQKPTLKNEPIANSTSGVASNRVVFEEYKTVLRQDMEKPFVSDPGLQKIVDRTYRQDASIGSGSTAAAIRHEKMTGEMVCDKLHSQKGEELINSLEHWLRQNPTASLGDRAAAENIIKDLKNALE